MPISRGPRRAPLVVVASPVASVADDAVAGLRRAGLVAYAARSADGCLRVATSVRPDVVLLDPALPRRVSSLLRAHPNCAGARFMPLTSEALSSVLPARADLRLVQPTSVLRPIPTAA